MRIWAVFCSFVKNYPLPILIPDDIIRQSELTEQEFKQEVAVLLYEAKLLNFGKARQLAGMDVLSFLEFLSLRKIEAPYTKSDFEQDLHLGKKIKLRP